MAQLLVKQGPRLGAAYVLEPDTVGIGRDNSNDIHLPNETMSRFHARFLFEGGRWTVTDLDSSNGTRLNGNRVDRAELRHMDEVQFGDVILIFMEDTPGLLTGEDSAPEITQVLDTGTMELLIDREDPLLRLSKQVNACRSLPELMETLSAAAAKALGADRIVPITVEADGSLRPWFGRSDTSNEVLAELPISTSVVGHVRRKREAVLSEVQSDERFSGSASVVRNEIATAMCVPLVSGGRELGVIYADRIAPAEPFARADLEMLAAMAMLMVGAIDGVRAAENLTDDRERLVDQIKLMHNIIGEHESVKAVLGLIERVAPADSSVLITGESGTGKELVARAIHYNSPRKGKAFEVVNCAALAPSLLESELFGHVKGAFTGAVQDRPGRFELAHEGTLFLDEIGEMPLDSQAKLLRVIEQGELRRVGDTRDRHVDVRIVAATNKQLNRMVAEGTFREDLFYRLDIVRIALPPLRDRGGDTGQLIDHFLAFFSSKCGRPPLSLSARARDLLQKYAWPGNVRELKNVIERLAVICRADEARPEDLPPEIRAGRAPEASTADVTASLADVERGHIVRVLAHTGGNKKEAASILGIDRSTLYAKLKQYGIDQG